MTNKNLGIIKLSDVKQQALKMAIEHNKEKPYHDFNIPGDKIIQAVEILAKNNYRYDNNTGIAYDKTGNVAQYTNYKESDKHNTIESIIEWEFIRIIINEAQRIIRLGKEYKY